MSCTSRAGRAITAQRFASGIDEPIEAGLAQTSDGRVLRRLSLRSSYLRARIARQFRQIRVMPNAKTSVDRGGAGRPRAGADGSASPGIDDALPTLNHGTGNVAVS